MLSYLKYYNSSTAFYFAPFWYPLFIIIRAAGMVHFIRPPQFSSIKFPIYYSGYNCPDVSENTVLPSSGWVSLKLIIEAAGFT